MGSRIILTQKATMSTKPNQSVWAQFQDAILFLVFLYGLDLYSHYSDTLRTHRMDLYVKSSQSRLNPSLSLRLPVFFLTHLKSWMWCSSLRAELSEKLVVLIFDVVCVRGKLCYFPLLEMGWAAILYWELTRRQISGWIQRGCLVVHLEQKI